MIMKKIIKALSLIELVTTLLIIAILMTVSVSTYSNSRMQYRRSEATSKLIQLKNNLQQLAFSKSTDVISIIEQIKQGTIKIPQDVGSYYTYTISNQNTSTYMYVLTATPIANKPQAKDSACTSIVLQVTQANEDIKLPENCWK